MNKTTLFLLISTLLISCNPNMEYEIRGFTEKIIVEGSIGTGQFPRVHLSLNVPLWQQVDSALILEKVIRTAKVTVSDGETTEVLTSGWDRDHFPPYVYRGTEIKGQEGKTYYLTVEYGGLTVLSKTYLPHAPETVKFETKPVAENDSLKILTVLMEMDQTEKKSYRLFSRKKIDGLFIETPVLYNENLTFTGTQTFTVSPATKPQHPSFNEAGYFLQGDSVIISIRAIDSTSTQFFKAFSVVSGIGHDIDIAQIKRLNSNIETPGFGIWYAYAAKNYLVVIE